MITWMKDEWFLNSKSSALGCCFIFAWFFANFSLALPIKVLLIKKACRWCHADFYTLRRKPINLQKLLFADIVRSCRSENMGKFLEKHPRWRIILVKLLLCLLYCRFSYGGNCELVNLFVGTKNFSYHICYENICGKHNKIYTLKSRFKRQRQTMDRRN